MTALRYLLDEHMSRHLAAGLRRRGVECVTVAELEKRGTLDPDHLAWARDEAWVVTTHDGAFVGLAHATPGHAGLVYCHQDKYSLGQLIERLQNLTTSESMEAIEGRVHYL